MSLFEFIPLQAKNKQHIFPQNHTTILKVFLTREINLSVV